MSREDGNVLRRTWGFEVEGQRMSWRPKRTSKKQFEEGRLILSREDVFCQSKLIVGVNRITTRLRCGWSCLFVGNNSGFKTLVSLNAPFLH